MWTWMPRRRVAIRYGPSALSFNWSTSNEFSSCLASTSTSSNQRPDSSPVTTHRFAWTLAIMLQLRVGHFEFRMLNVTSSQLKYKSTCSEAGSRNLTRAGLHQQRSCDVMAKSDGAWITTSYMLSPYRTASLLHVLDCLDAMSKCKFFSICDADNAYHQCLVDQHDADKLALVTHEGIFTPRVLLFGPRNAPAYFQRHMSTTVSDLPHCIAYLMT
jgi:hypothetical protein